MNIEEAIDKVDRFVNTITVILPKYSTAIPEYCIDEESWIAIKKVLTAYEKEKEKNKKAIDFINDKNNYFEDGENWQNILKIKEILEE